MRVGLGGLREDRVERPGAILLLLLRASELFAKDAGEGIHGVFCVRSGDTAFFRGDHQAFGSRVEDAYKAETMFRGSKGDQGRNGAILMRTVGPARREHGAVER